MAPDQDNAQTHSDSPGHVVAKGLEEQIQAFIKLLRRIRHQRHREPDEELVHDLRVGSRRLLAAMAISEAVTDGAPKHHKRFSRWRKCVKRPFRALAPIRDLEVAEEESGKLQTSEPAFQAVHQYVCEQLATVKNPTIKEVRKRLLPKTRQSLKRKRKAARKALQATDAQCVLLRLRAWLLAQQRQARRCLKRLDPARPASFHNLRVTLKWLRYGCEFLSTLKVTGMDAARASVTAARCRDVQQQLGEIQDDVVLLGFVEQGLETPEVARAHILRRQQAAMGRVLAMKAELQAVLREAHQMVLA